MKKNSGLIAQHSALCWGEAMARILYLFLTIAMVVAWAIAEAQQPGKIFRIGRLDVSTASGSAVLWDAFRKELSSLGWTEGKTSPSNTDWPSKGLSVCRNSRRSWFVLRLI